MPRFWILFWYVSAFCIEFDTWLIRIQTFAGSAHWVNNSATQLNPNVAMTKPSNQWNSLLTIDYFYWHLSRDVTLYLWGGCTIACKLDIFVNWYDDYHTGIYSNHIRLYGVPWSHYINILLSTNRFLRSRFCVSDVNSCLNRKWFHWC